MLGALPVVCRSLISTVLRKWIPNYRPLLLSFLSLYVGEGYCCTWSHPVIDTSQSVGRIWARDRPLLSFLDSASKHESDECLSSFLILYFICSFSLIFSLFRRVYILLLCLWKFFRLFDRNPRATGKPMNRSSLNFILGDFANTRAATWIVFFFSTLDKCNGHFRWRHMRISTRISKVQRPASPSMHKTKYNYSYVYP